MLIQRSKYPDPCKDDLRKLFHYPACGELVWVAGRCAGRQAGCIDKAGYRRVDFSKGRRGLKASYRMHRLVWIWHYGDIPEGMVIDHVDRNKANNMVENLRLMTVRGNYGNRQVVGKGVRKMWSGWEARVTICNKSVTLGTYFTEDVARGVYKEWADRRDCVLRGEGEDTPESLYAKARQAWKENREARARVTGKLGRGLKDG